MVCRLDIGQWTLTKSFIPPPWTQKNFTQIFLYRKFFQTQNCFWTQFFLVPKFFSNTKFFQTPNFFLPKFFQDQNFFLTQNNFWTHFFSDPKFFLTQNELQWARYLSFLNWQGQRFYTCLELDLSKIDDCWMIMILFFSSNLISKCTYLIKEKTHISAEMETIM